MEEERGMLLAEREDALTNLWTLENFLQICAHCRKIKDDTGNWIEIESSITDQSGTDFSHSLCPASVKKLYPWYL